MSRPGGHPHAAGALCVLGAVLLASCGPGEAPRTAERAPGLRTKDGLYREGHQLYLTGALDSARALLERAAALDSSYREPVADLASLHYDRAMAQRGETSPARRAALKEALRYYIRLERMGDTGAATYERLCEVAAGLEDDRTFLRYARKSAERYPYDRQFYNLGVASLNAGDYPGVVTSQKEAAEKFRQSPYLGGFYRLLGQAYMKMDRDQTAERSLETGLKAVDARLAAVKAGIADEASARLRGDRVAILQLLRRLHQTYHKDEKLREVERLLKASGGS